MVSPFTVPSITYRAVTPSGRVPSPSSFSAPVFSLNVPVLIGDLRSWPLPRQIAVPDTASLPSNFSSSRVAPSAPQWPDTGSAAAADCATADARNNRTQHTTDNVRSFMTSLLSSCTQRPAQQAARTKSEGFRVPRITTERPPVADGARSQRDASSLPTRAASPTVRRPLPLGSRLAPTAA
jgi:hypothetical protein